jgi:hypothetical protein
MKKKNQNKKKEPTKVYLTKYNMERLSKKEIEILKEQYGKYIRCTDILPED